jgi:hypothetical protein
MSAKIRLAAPLRSLVGGETTVPIDAADLGALPEAIAQRYPDLAGRILTGGRFGKFVTVFIDGRTCDTSPDTSLASALSSVLPAVVAGGRSRARVAQSRTDR